MPAANDDEDPDSFSFEYGGKRYSAELLFGSIPRACVEKLNAMGPCTLQECWDEIVRGWPAVADEIVAGSGDQVS